MRLKTIWWEVKDSIFKIIRKNNDIETNYENVMTLIQKLLYNIWKICQNIGFKVDWLKSQKNPVRKNILKSLVNTVTYTKNFMQSEVSKKK